MRDIYIKMLTDVNNELKEMGNLIITAISNAINGLETQDLSYCGKVFEIEEHINQEEKDIESLCINLILRQQPVANDLRLITSALKMITDMERIGDNAVDIANIAKKLADQSMIKELDILPKMANETVKMVGLSIEAFVDKNLEAVKQVIDTDDNVDTLFDTAKNELAALISHNPESADTALELLMAAKYFEKISDHAVNIANWVEYGITGSHGRIPEINSYASC